MRQLQQFVDILSGHFDNSQQLEELRAQGISDFPAARHLNTPCNHKITGLPQDFAGIFLVEESYYTTNGSTHSSPHLFLFTQEGDQIKLTSYEVPDGYDKNSFTYEQLGALEFGQLKASEKFTPALYTLKDGVWEGGSVSMFTPAVKFTLFERFSPQLLEVSETMEVNGRRTFGFDRPILYRRVQEGE